MSWFRMLQAKMVYVKRVRVGKEVRCLSLISLRSVPRARLKFAARPWHFLLPAPPRAACLLAAASLPSRTARLPYPPRSSCSESFASSDASICTCSTICKLRPEFGATSTNKFCIDGP
eukprot:25240_6